MNTNEALPAPSPQRCPNCGAPVAPGTLVCPACGVHIAVYQQLQSQVEQARGEQSSARVRERARAAAERVAADRAREQVQRKRQLFALLAGTVVMAILIAVAAGIYRHQRQLAAERLRRDLERAAGCLEAQDYLCARDLFLGVPKRSRDQQVVAGLHAARLGLAKQYAQAGQWESATDELEVALAKSPGDAKALALLEDIYGRWYRDALGRGDLIEALRVKLQQEARFSRASPGAQP